MSFGHPKPEPLHMAPLKGSSIKSLTQSPAVVPLRAWMGALSISASLSAAGWRPPTPGSSCASARTKTSPMPTMCATRCADACALLEVPLFQQWGNWTTPLCVCVCVFVCARKSVHECIQIHAHLLCAKA